MQYAKQRPKKMPVSGLTGRYEGHSGLGSSKVFMGDNNTLRFSYKNRFIRIKGSNWRKIKNIFKNHLRLSLGEN